MTETKYKRKGLVNSIARAAWDAEGVRLLKVAVNKTLSFLCDRGESRTPDLRVMNPTLLPTELPCRMSRLFVAPRGIEPRFDG